MSFPSIWWTSTWLRHSKKPWKRLCPVFTFCRPKTSIWKPRLNVRSLLRLSSHCSRSYSKWLRWVSTQRLSRKVFRSTKQNNRPLYSHTRMMASSCILTKRALSYCLTSSMQGFICWSSISRSSSSFGISRCLMWRASYGSHCRWCWRSVVSHQTTNTQDTQGTTCPQICNL